MRRTDQPRITHHRDRAITLTGRGREDSRSIPSGLVPTIQNPPLA